MFGKISPVLGLLFLGLVSVSAYAATTTDTFNVTATVQPICSVSASGLSFGSYQPTSSAVDASTTIQVTCTHTTTYNVGLDQGKATGATVTTRQMGGTNGNTDMLKYGLYSGSDHKTNWGNTVSSDTVPGTGSGSSQTLTVFGEIPANQLVAPDNYSDIITVTVTY